MTIKRILIFANGVLPNIDHARAMLQEGDYFICADGGSCHALALGVTPQLIIGDMDSTPKETLSHFQQMGVEIEIYPRDKNETDLELAIARAIEREPGEIIIVGALGGRMDQTLANIALLTNADLVTRNVRLDDGTEEIFFVQNQAQVKGRSGDLVSLIPWGAPVKGVQTQDLSWPLRSETLYPDKTRGISNEMTGTIATIKIESGLLLVIHTRQS